MKNVRTILAFLIALTASHALAETTGSEAAVATVTYVTGSTAYIDVGRDDGLSPGDEVEIVRDGSVITRIVVREVSNHRATCSLVDVEVRVGDVVRYSPAKSEPEPVAAAVPDPPKRRASRRRGSGVHGRVGVRYMAVTNRIEGGTSYSQPALDLRLDGNHVAGSPMSLAVDVRARRTSRTLADGADVADDRTRVYRLALSYNTLGAPWTVTAGRQYSPNLANVSLFDGVSFDFVKPRWGVGGFTGSQPDAEDFGFSSTIREHGVYAQVRGDPTSDRRWSLVTGLVGSYEESEVNREFVYVQARYVGRKLFAFGIQELDFNRDWKSEFEDESVSPTSTFVSLRYAVTRSVSLLGGYDNRRNVRLYRDRVTPETLFDDSFRRGVWLGTSMTFLRYLRFGLDARTNSGGTAGESEAYSATLGAAGLSRRNFSVRGRGTAYANDFVDGQLYSLGFGVQPVTRLHLGLYGGVRDETGVLDEALDRSITWYGFDVEVTLGRRWYMLASIERNEGDLEEYDQLYSSLTYRF